MPTLLSKSIRLLLLVSNNISGYKRLITFALSIAIFQGSYTLESVILNENPLHIFPSKRPLLGTITAGENSIPGRFNAFSSITRSDASLILE